METENNGNELPPDVVKVAEQLANVDVQSGLVESTAEPEPTPEEQEAVSNQLVFNEQNAQLTAWGGLAAIEGTLKLVLHPRFEFSPEARAEALEKFAPLLVKYGLLLPEFLMRYMDEIEAAKAAVTLAADGYKKVKVLRLEDAVEKKRLMAELQAKQQAEKQAEAANHVEYSAA